MKTYTFANSGRDGGKIEVHAEHCSHARKLERGGISTWPGSGSDAEDAIMAEIPDLPEGYTRSYFRVMNCVSEPAC